MFMPSLMLVQWLVERFIVNHRINTIIKSSYHFIYKHMILKYLQFFFFKCNQEPVWFSHNKFMCKHVICAEMIR